jgi:hypothetical protein
MIKDIIYVIKFELDEQPGKALYVGENVPVTDFLPAAKNFKSPSIAYKAMEFHKKHHKSYHDLAVFKIRRNFEFVDDVGEAVGTAINTDPLFLAERPEKVSEYGYLGTLNGCIKVYLAPELEKNECLIGHHGRTALREPDFFFLLKYEGLELVDFFNTEDEPVTEPGSFVVTFEGADDERGEQKFVLPRQLHEFLTECHNFAVHNCDYYVNGVSYLGE